MDHYDLLHKFIADNGDISQHLETLTKYAAECSSVVELGVRTGCSTLALLCGNPSYLTSFDINGFHNYELYQKFAKTLGVNFAFVQENVLTTNKISNCDLLFIDTLHSYDQLMCELYLHGNKASKYIIFHDTVTYASHDEGKLNHDTLPEELKDYLMKVPPAHGLIPAINKFLVENNHWNVKEFYQNNNGLCILERR